MPKNATYTVAKKLSDGGHYILSLFDLEPSGLLVRAYNQLGGVEYTISITEKEVRLCNILRNDEGYRTLLDTIDIHTKENEGDHTYIYSSYDAIHTPYQLPNDINEYLSSHMLTDSTSLSNVLCEALCELCKVKPSGIEAVRWLGEYLISHNPTQPHIDEPIIEESTEENVHALQL